MTPVLSPHQLYFSSHFQRSSSRLPNSAGTLLIAITGSISCRSLARRKAICGSGTAGRIPGAFIPRTRLPQGSDDKPHAPTQPCFSVGDEIWVTRCHQRDAISCKIRGGGSISGRRLPCTRLALQWLVVFYRRRRPHHSGESSNAPGRARLRLEQNERRARRVWLLREFSGGRAFVWVGFSRLRPPSSGKPELGAASTRSIAQSSRAYDSRAALVCKRSRLNRTHWRVSVFSSTIPEKKKSIKKPRKEEETI